MTDGRNPPWERDELILALDLYLRQGLLDDTDPRVTELSDTLNRLPLHPLRPDATRFRNRNSVALKLANFASLDPGYPGKGMPRGGRRDREVWEALAHRPDEVERLAAAIRAEAYGGRTLPAEEGEEEVLEGRLLFRRHRARERDRRLVERKKRLALAAHGRLACEVCSFDFGAVYGPWGEDFIECHHVVPLGRSPGEVRTRLSDLALVCANCHRILHRGRTPPTIEELRSHVRNRGRDASRHGAGTRRRTRTPPSPSGTRSGNL